MKTQSFESFMNLVDACISEEMGGLTSSDLPDASYMEYYEEGVSPEDVAAEVLGYMEG